MRHLIVRAQGSSLARGRRSPPRNRMKTRSAMMLAVCVFLLLLGASFLAPNYSEEYCTTKAYGFPLCWKVEHCLCNKGKVVYYPQGVVGNMLMSAVAATVVAVARRKRD